MVLADGNVYDQRGTPIFVNRQVDLKTGTIVIKGRFPNPGNLLRPGQFAKVRAVVRTEKGALLVPQRAVQEQQGTFHVAVVGADNKVSLRPVTPGDRVGNLWIIEKGLSPNERVIVEGLQKVRDGAEVTPTVASGADAGAAPSPSAPASPGA
jgi:membrane fusion protein (multidrug efflux system)